MRRKTCSVKGCDCQSISRGWCNKHWQRWRKYGDPTAGGRPRPGAGEPLAFLENIALTHDSDECLLWPFRKIGKGYGAFQIGGKSVYCHRWVCEKTHGNPPSSRHQVAHSCGNRPCCNPLHLRWATKAENEADKLVHGSLPRGEQISWSKLTRENVREIRRLRGQLTQSQLGKMFGVSVGAINGVQRRATWSHIQ